MEASMIKITRYTHQGWKTYEYENQDLFNVGRPRTIRSATLEEIQNPDKEINEQEVENDTELPPGGVTDSKKKKNKKENEIGKEKEEKEMTKEEEDAFLDEGVAEKRKMFDELFRMLDAGRISTEIEVENYLESKGVKNPKEQNKFVKMLRKRGASIEGIREQEEKAEPTSEKEGGAKDKWTIKDFADQIEEWKKAGFDDEKKLQGMIDRATEIAKESTESAPGKATRAEVLGILQGFMQEKG